MPAAPTPPAPRSGVASGAEPKSEPRGYFLALSQVIEVQRFQQYRSLVAKLRQVYAGRELVRAQPIVTVLGPPTEGVLTIVEHETMAHLRMLLAAPEYGALLDKLGTLAPGPTWAVPGVWPVPKRLPAAPSSGELERIVRGGPVPDKAPRAYAVAQYRIDDPARLNQFRDLIGRIVVARGGRFLVRLEPVDPASATSTDEFLTLVEFDSLATLYAAVDSPDYRDMLALGLGHGNPRLWIVEGAPE